MRSRMKVFVGLAILALASSTNDSGQNAEERKRDRVEKLAAMSVHMSGHLREQRHDHAHAQEAPANLKMYARKGDVGLKVERREPSTKNLGHADKMRRVSEQLVQQHQRKSKVVESTGALRPNRAHLAKQSLAYTSKTDNTPREPSAASAAKKAKQHQSLHMVAKHMSHALRADAAAAARDAVVKGAPGLKAMKARAQVDGRTASTGDKVTNPNVKAMGHKFAQTMRPKGQDPADTEGLNLNPP